MNVTSATYPIPSEYTWDILDSSKLQCFQECPRKYFWQYVLGWQSAQPNNHLYFGEAMHKALEVLYKDGFHAEAVSDAYEVFLHYYRQYFPEDTDGLYFPKTPANLLDALLGYVDKYSTDLRQYEVVQLESSGAVPINDEDSLHMRVDSIMMDLDDGKFISMEHKSGSSAWKWDMQWQLKIQIGTYTHCMYCMYPIDRVKGVLVNGIFFKKNKTNPIDYLRVPCWKTPSQMNGWLRMVNRWAAALKAEFAVFTEDTPSAAVMEAFPQNPESCTKYTGCPYHDYCCAYPNPLQHCERPPLGMEVSHWDPTAFETAEKIVIP